MEAKGKCSVCGNFVYGHEERWKKQDGSYVHLDCRLTAHGGGALDNKVLARARPAQGEEGWGRGAERARAPMERPVLRGPCKGSSPPERETPKDSIILARARLARGEGGGEDGAKGGGGERELAALRADLEVKL